MMTLPIPAFWGALLGWFLMPRIRGLRSARAFKPIRAYVSAIIIAVAVMYIFEYHRQAWLFVLGMVAQMAVFVAAAWLRQRFAKVGRR
jgi:uncharacterized membrane protein YcaP (DUF421 family)